MVLLPIIRSDADQAKVMEYTRQLSDRLSQTDYHGHPLRVEIDDRNIGGARNWEWIKKGIPLRVEIGPKDMASDSVFVGRRDKHYKERASIGREQFIGEIGACLDEIQSGLFDRALSFRQANTQNIDDINAFNVFFTPKNAEKPEIHGGFALSHWCGDAACEADIKDRLNVTIRCIPFDQEDESGKCITCGRESRRRVVFAKAY